MANNMQSFDFDALDWAALDETVSFLNNLDPALLRNPSPAGFGSFGEPMMDWPTVENHGRDPLGSADLSGGVTDPLTDCSLPGFHFTNPGSGFENQPYHPEHGMGAEAPLSFGESSGKHIPCQATNISILSPIPAFSIAQVLPGGLTPTKPSTVQVSQLGIVCDPREPYQLPESMAASCLTCDWPSCKSTAIYVATRDLQHHQRDVHVAEILNDWPGSCSWPGCNSKIFFKMGKRLEDHVYNIHITPLCCTTRGCDHNRPFERQADLERHVASRHTKAQSYKCPHPTCQYKFSFSRKDKLKHHEKTYHGQFPCQSNHCANGFISNDTARRHRKNWNFHSYDECGLGSCARTSKSGFNRNGLSLHLIHDHLISSDAAQHALGKMGWEVIVLTLAHFPGGFSEFQDCKGCIEKLKETASDKEGEDKN